MDAVRADEMMAQFSANAEQWSSMIDPTWATDPNAAEMDMRWEHNLLADRNNVTAYFGDRQMLSAVHEQGTEWDGIGSDMWDWATTGHSALAGDFTGILNGDED